jgi:hypothetical protein
MTAQHRALSRRGFRLNVAIFLVAVAVITVAVNFFAQRSGLRLRIDATKTRAYSLSSQTVDLLESLEGEWAIAIVMVEQEIDRDARQQVDEVLKRYRQASPALSVVRIDPTNPRTLDDYDRLLTRLRSLYADEISEYDIALDEGEEAFRSLEVFAQGQTSVLERLAAGSAEAEPIEERRAVLELFADQAPRVLDAVAAARRVTDARPLPDYETARSVLAQALTRGANELYDTARRLDEWAARGDADGKAVVGPIAAAFDEQAQALAWAADPLRRLPVIELAAIGRQLEKGDTAVIVGPGRAGVIPTAQLFPKINVRNTDEGVITFDRRFRGEQIISATFRSMLVDHMPLVVFVHAEETSLVLERPQYADLVGVATSLRASQFELAEWIVTRGERPEAAPGQPVVWVGVPPIRRQGFEPSAGELALVRALRRLIEEGASVMVNLSPSPLPKYGKDDPWLGLTAPLGVSADTARVIVEQSSSAEGETSNQLAQIVRDFPGDHPICRAVHGQQSAFGWPVGLSPVESVDELVAHAPLVLVKPRSSRWLEDDWISGVDHIAEPPSGRKLQEPVSVALAVERRRPEGGGAQRCLVVGSGTWMLSYLADAVVPIGGGRVALTNPGNQELMLASVAWLAGMDDLIAPSPLSQQVARLDGLTPWSQLMWLGITALGIPALCFACGIGVWVVRNG